MKPSRLAARVASRARSDICCARFWMRLDPGDGVCCALFYGSEDVAHPRLPIALFRDRAQQTVIDAAVCHEVTADVDDRSLEQAPGLQVEDVQDASGAAVTVAERVNGLELVVHDGHLDERIDSVRRAWMRMDRFGRDSASALTRASATLASMQVLRMAGVSRSVLGGNSGRAFQGTPRVVREEREEYPPAEAYTFSPKLYMRVPDQGEHAYFLALGEARRMTSVVSGAPPAPSPRTCSESGSTSPSSEQTGAAAPTFCRPCASVPCCRRSTLLPRSPACARPRTDRHRRRVCRRAGAG